MFRMKVSKWCRDRRILSALLSVLLVVTMAVLTQAAPTEMQPPVPAPTDPVKPGPRVSQPPKLTSEQEAALVDVRKILQEARQVAEGIEVPSGPLTKESTTQKYERVKEQLLDHIEETQLIAGDVSIKTVSKGKGLFAVHLSMAQARYGYTKEAVQTVTSDTSYHGGRELIDALLKAGDVSAAVTVAEAYLSKDGFDASRHRDEAVIFALIARRQHEAGDPMASQSLQRALKAAQAVKWPEYRYRALTHVARTQALLGNRAGSAESFAQAVQAAKQYVQGLSAGYHEAMRPHALRMVAKAQAESGDIEGSVQTFQEALRFAHALSDPKIRIFVVSCIAWAQSASGDRPGGLQTLQDIRRFAETLPTKEQQGALREITLWQLKVSDQDGARENMQRMQKLGADVISLMVNAGDLSKAMTVAAETPQTGKQKADYLRFFAEQLIKKKDPLGTPEVFQDLARKATELLENSLPQDRVFADRMRESIALVQAAAGDIARALRTLEAVSTLPSLAHSALIKLLLDKGDAAGARQVTEQLKEDWLPWADGWRELGRGYSRLGKTAEGVALARQQQSPYSRARMLLGLAEGLIEQQGIKSTLMFQGPDIPEIEHCPDTRG